MLKRIGRLGGGLLHLLRFVFLTRDARRKLKFARAEAPPREDAAVKGSRQELIAQAVSLHREKQDVLAKLDDKSRRKLAAMAHRMMSPPAGTKRR